MSLKDSHIAIFGDVAFLFRSGMDAKKRSKLEEFEKLFVNADENKIAALTGLIEEAFDCKAEILELKEDIQDLKEQGARFRVLERRERLLNQKRASYTNMMAKLCRELCAVQNATLDDEGLEDYL